MRYVPAGCLRENMVCGKRVLGKNGALLLNTGTALTGRIIQNIKDIGLSGIYIDDTYTRDIQIEDILSDTRRANSVKAVKQMFDSIANGKEDAAKRIRIVVDLVDGILNSVISHQSLNVNLRDLKTFDDYTYYHSVNVGVLAILIGHAAGFGHNDLHTLGVAAMLHDIGKVFVPLGILNKPGKLSSEEFEVIKSHVTLAHDYLTDKFHFGTSVLSAVLDHHERHDGSGYPNQRRGSDISTFGMIIAIADVFDALTSDRPYRPALPAHEAVEYIMGCASSAFSEELVKTFLNNVMPFSPGTMVRLSDGSEAVVLRNNQQNSLRPVVRVVRRGDADVEPHVLDLQNDYSTLGITILGLATGLRDQSGTPSPSISAMPGMAAP